jgi:hypothetical protein
MSYLKTTLITLVALSIGGLLTSCDSFLSEEPKGSLSGSVVENEKGVETLLIGTYSALSPTDGGTLAIAGGLAWTADPAHWPYGAVASDVAQKGSEPTDQQEANSLMDHSWTPTNGYFNGLWQNRFEGVARANSVLQALDNAEGIPDATATRMRAEARFLRAYFYFDLKKNFGNVPLVTDTTEDFNQPNDIENEIIWPQIESDLRFAAQNLPVEMPDQARANKWAAASFLAKAHVYQQDWGAAKALFNGSPDLLNGQNIIQNGATASGVSYALEEQYSTNFNAATQGSDNSEIIFGVEMTGTDGSGDMANSWAGYKLNYPQGVAPFGCCGFFLGSYDLVNSYKTTASGLPNPDGFNTAFNGMDKYLKNTMGDAPDDKFTPATNASLDPRLDWTVGRRGVPFHDHGPHPGTRYIRADESYAGVYTAKKHVWRRANTDIANNPNSWAPGTGVDYPSMRFADVLLMAAEAELQAGNGSVDQARQYVNDVRSRAANSNGYVNNSMNEAYALAVVDNEADMLDTSPSAFDWVVRTDRNSTFMFLGGDASNIDNWNEYPNPVSNYNIDTYSMAEFTSGVSPLRKVHFERKLELAMEGHRFYDLARWDRAESRMNEYFDYQGEMTTDVDPSDTYRGAGIFPIPQSQIDISTVDGEQLLKQNPQYQ